MTTSLCLSFEFFEIAPYIVLLMRQNVNSGIEISKWYTSIQSNLFNLCCTLSLVHTATSLFQRISCHGIYSFAYLYKWNHWDRLTYFLRSISLCVLVVGLDQGRQASLDLGEF